MEPTPLDQSREDFVSLLQRAREGNLEACRVLFDRFQKKVLMVVRRRLDHRIRPLLDSFDVTQDVWQSFFCRILPQEAFETPEGFLRYLTTLTENKVLEQNRYHIAVQKRSVSRVRYIAQHTAEVYAQPGQASDPARVAEQEDEWAAVLKELSPDERRILHLLRSGMKVADICRDGNVSSRTVFRILQRIRKKTSP
jgi:RNA polymerase sigma factor (sigma-70 family)